MKVLFLLALSVLCFFVGVGMSIKRAWFLMHAVKTSGAVVQITSFNTRCGSKNNKYDCTDFNAHVEFKSADGKSKGMIEVDAGNARGHNQPANRASLQNGDPVPVVYDPSDLNNAFHDSFGSLWGFPLGSFVGSGLFCLGAFSRRRRY